MNTPSITFVTAFFKIYDTPPIENHTIEWRLNHFDLLAKTGISLVIYTCEEYGILLQPYLAKYSNLRIAKIMNLKDTIAWRMFDIMKHDINLPKTRSITKDTKEFIALQNSKTEFMKYAIEENVFQSTHFSWIDFNIFHIFKENPEYAFNTLHLLSQNKIPLQKEDFIVIPGCWNVHSNEYNEVCWRFCGGFFLGTVNAILQFHKLYETYFYEFLITYKVFAWEINFWSWLEKYKGFKPIWYSANHNLSMLEFTRDVYSIALPYTKSCDYDITPVCIENNMNMGEYVSTSISYLHVNYRNILNIRFVNYTIEPNGCYIIRHENRHLYTRNICAILNNENMNNHDINNCKINEMKEENMVNYGGSFYGLEDIRLYQLEGEDQIRFISSNSNYVPNLKIRILSGIYDVENACCRDIRILHPPTDTYCEKNWIPLPTVPTDLERGEYFIYKWFPFQIGYLDDTDQLNIVKTYKHNNAFWRDVRGSSILVETDDGYLCVVHTSEEKHPRHYFHMLVLLEKRTYRPIKYSDYFYFHKKSIEFCIGFTISESNYCFWISNFDRDSEYLEIPCNSIDLCYDIMYTS